MGGRADSFPVSRISSVLAGEKHLRQGPLGFRGEVLTCGMEDHCVSTAWASMDPKQCTMKVKNPKAFRD